MKYRIMKNDNDMYKIQYKYWPWWSTLERYGYEFSQIVYFHSLAEAKEKVLELQKDDVRAAKGKLWKQVWP